ncbi:MAG: NUDIX domain-containing protein [Bacteroidales bacterium]
MLYMRNSKQMVLAKQWRASDNTENINLFGGYLDKGENYFQALVREMKEETNLDFTESVVSDYYVVYHNKKVSSGTSTERNSLYIIIIEDTPELLSTMKCNDKKEGIEFYFKDYGFGVECDGFALDGVRGTFALTYLELLLGMGAIV